MKFRKFTAKRKGNVYVGCIKIGGDFLICKSSQTLPYMNTRNQFIKNRTEAQKKQTKNNFHSVLSQSSKFKSLMEICRRASKYDMENNNLKIYQILRTVDKLWIVLKLVS